MSIIESSFENSNHQLANLWDFFISKKENEDWPLIARVQNTTLPFINLTTETRNTGEKAYTGFEPIGEFSMTFYENRDFSTFQYFKDWMNDVFDETQGTFISQGENVEKGSSQDLIHRTGFLSFESFRIDSRQTVEIYVKELTKGLNDNITATDIRSQVKNLIQTKELRKASSSSVITQEIVGGLIQSLGGQIVNTAVRSAVNAVNRVGGVFGRPNLIGNSSSTGASSNPPPTLKSFDTKNQPRSLIVTQERVERISQNIQRNIIRESVPVWTPYETKSFRYEGLKLLGLSEVSLDYDNVDALQFDVNFTADRIVET